MSENINETTRYLKFRYISIFYKSSTDFSWTIHMYVYIYIYIYICIYAYMYMYIYIYTYIE